MKRNYRQDIIIDEENLEYEWINQPSLMLYYNEMYAIALENKDNCKNNLERVFAKADSDIRNDWKKYFKSKPTEVAIKNYVLLMPEYIKAEKLLLNATKQANMMSGVKSSFEHRKYALQNLVSLKISGFYSEPKNLQREVEKRKRRSAEREADENRKEHKAALKNNRRRRPKTKIKAV